MPLFLLASAINAESLLLILYTLKPQSFYIPLHHHQLLLKRLLCLPQPTPEPTLMTISHVSPPFSYKEPQLSSTCYPQACRWSPYSSSSQFEGGVAVVVVILLSALLCAIFLGTAICFFLRSRGSGVQHSPGRLPRTTQALEQPKPIPETIVSLLVTDAPIPYTAGLKLAGTDAECTICLSEFEEGDPIRVLEKCKHGFHADCIQQWLPKHVSCPTCRTVALSSSPVPEETTECCISSNSQPPQQNIAQVIAPPAF